MTIQNFEVREGKTPLVLGWMLIILGLFFVLICCVSGSWAVFAILAVFILLPCFVTGYYCVSSYYRRRLAVNSTTLVYTTGFGRTREFSLSDIQTARVTVMNYSATIRLLNHDGKTLARLESNMFGFDVLADYLEAHKLLSLSGLNQEQFDKDHWEYTHKNQINLGLWGLRVLSLALLALTTYLLFQVKLRYVSILCTTVPLLFFVYYACFPNVIVWDKPRYSTPEWRKAHISFPFLFFLLWELAAFMASDLAYPLVYVSPWQPVVLGCVVLTLFFLVLWRRTPQHRRNAGTVVMLLFCGLFLAAVAAFHLPYATYLPDKTHEQAVVLDTRQYTDNEGSINYYVTVDYQGKAYELSVSSLLFDMARNNYPLELCIRNSLVGIDFLMLHKVSG